MDLSYTIRSSSRAKRMRLTLHPDGSVVVTKPLRVPESYISSFIQKYAGWIARKREAFSRRPPRLLGKHSRTEYNAYREQARVLVTNKLQQFNSFYNFTYGGVRIGNQRSRWGSCSAKKNLNFNYKIVFLPEHLQNYLIVHELCHLAEMNHGTGFWNLVAQQIPDHKALRKELHRY